MINLLDPAIMETIVGEIENGEERDRKRQAFDAYQVFSGNLKNYVETELARTRPKSWKSYSVSNVSLSKMVTKKLAKAYNNEPIRTVGDDSKNERLDEIYEESMAQRNLQEFDEIFNLHKHSLLWINYREKEERYQFMALAPYEYSVIRNKDTGRVEVVILSYPDTTITSSARLKRGTQGGDGKANLIAESQVDSGGQTRVYAMWSDEQYVVVRVTVERIKTIQGEEVKKSIEYVPLEDNPNNVNPLGVLPFVYLSADLSPDYPTINPITEQTITFNALWSELLTAANIQGTSIMTFEYPAELQGKMDKMTTGLTSAVELPQLQDKPPTKVNFISPSPDLGGQKESYMQYMQMVLAEHGITSSQGLDGMESFSSGLERMIAQADVQQIIDKHQQMYSKVEDGIFEILKRWEAFLGPSVFAEEDQLTVIFTKPRVMISDAETLANIEKRLSLGLIQKWEALAILDPNLGEDEAKEKLEVINEERSANTRGFFGNREPGQTSNEDSES